MYIDWGLNALSAQKGYIVPCSCVYKYTVT